MPSVRPMNPASSATKCSAKRLGHTGGDLPGNWWNNGICLKDVLFLAGLRNGFLRGFFYL